MTHATPSGGLLARLFAPLRLSGKAELASVRRAAALALVPLALAPSAFAQRGGTTGDGYDRGGARRDTAVVMRRPAVPPSARPAPPRSGYDEAQRRAEEQRRVAEERQREAERRIEDQRREAEERQRVTERRIEQQRREAEDRQREAQRRAGGQNGYPGYGQPGYGGYDRGGYGGAYDRYWGSSWSPVLRYRQRVRVESDRRYGYGSSVLDIRTHYRQRTSGGYNGERVDVRIERIEVYQDGRFLGYVDYYDLPGDFDHVTATRMRNGELRLDDDLLLVGEASVGFELIRFDGNDFYGAWRRQYDALALDLRRSSARRVGYSRLFDPYDYRGYVPVSIVPDFQDDFYGYGQPGYGGYDQGGYGQPGYDRGGYEGPTYNRSPRGGTSGSGTVNPPPSRPQGSGVEGRSAPARSPRNRTITLPGGQTVQVEREASVEAAEGGGN